MWCGNQTNQFCNLWLLNYVIGGQACSRQQNNSNSVPQWKVLKSVKRFYSIKNALNILFIAGHNEWHAFCVVYVLKQQSFGQFGGHLKRGKDPCLVAQSALQSSSLSQIMYLPSAVFSVCSGSHFFHRPGRLLLLSYSHTHSSLAAQGVWRETGGSRRQWLCFGHRTDQRWDQKVPSWSSCQLLLSSQR